MSRLRMNWITAPALQLLLSLHAGPHLSLCFLPVDAMRGLRTTPGTGAGLRKTFPAFPSPPIRVITSRPLNIRILSPLCVQSPSGICRPSSRFASSVGFWLAPWFIGPLETRMMGGIRERFEVARLGIGESFKRRAALETRRKAMSPLSELLHNVLLSAPRWGGSDRRRRDGALSV